MKTLSLLSVLFSLNAFAGADGFKVSFNSIGTGIDGSALKITRTLTGQALAEGNILSYQEARWGREGERTLCIRFNANDDADTSAQFKKLLEKALAGSTRFNISEITAGDAGCKN